jgi:hypothetical protein
LQDNRTINLFVNLELYEIAHDQPPSRLQESAIIVLRFSGDPALSLLTVKFALQIHARDRVLTPIVGDHCHRAIFYLNARQQSAGWMVCSRTLAEVALEACTPDFPAEKTLEAQTRFRNFIDVAHDLSSRVVSENRGLFDIHRASAMGVELAVFSRKKVFVVQVIRAEDARNLPDSLRV